MVDFKYLRSSTALESLVDFNLDVNDLEGAEESLRVFYSILDFFGRIANNLRTYLLNGFKSFKRSELHAYVSSYTTSTSRLMNRPSAKFKDVMVPVPDGMTGTYPVVTELLLKWFEKGAFKDVMISAMHYLELYDKKTVDEYAGLIKDTRHATEQIAKIKKDDLEKSLQKVFLNRHTHKEQKAGVVIGTHRALKEVHKGVLGFEEHYFVAAAAVKDVDVLEKKIDIIVKRLKGLKDIDPQYLKSFHAFVSELAVQLDMFGVLLDYGQRLEHNYVLALRKIVSEYED